MNSNKKISFLFCRTPLQSMIVNQLIDEISSDVVVVYHATSKSKKHQYYFNKINAQKKYFVPWHNSSLSQTWNDTIAWWQIPKAVRQEKYDVLYAASFTSILFSAIRGKNLKAILNTFDDGVINLNTKANLAWWYDEPRNPRIVKWLLGGVFNKDIMTNVNRHYTIFNKDDILKWTSSIYELNLLKKNLICSDIQPEKIVRVLLGTWTNDSSLQKQHDEIINSQKFDLFLPHPADSRMIKVGPKLHHLNVNNVFDELIAEDVTQLIISSGYKPIVYGFSSTSLVNLHEVVQTVNIRFSHSSRFTQIDELISRLGIRTLNLISENKKTSISSTY